MLYPKGTPLSSKSSPTFLKAPEMTIIGVVWNFHLRYFLQGIKDIIYHFKEFLEEFFYYTKTPNSEKTLLEKIVGWKRPIIRSVLQQAARL
jgi:hypothetical protein